VYGGKGLLFRLVSKEDLAIGSMSSLLLNNQLHILRMSTHSMPLVVRPCLLCIVTNIDNDLLTAPFTKEEFCETMFAMHPNKCSTPDGYNLCFYQHLWNLCNDVFHHPLVDGSFKGGAKLCMNLVHHNWHRD